MDSMKNKNWFVYMLECSDGTIYTGITTDLKRRLYEHNHTTKGAKYTRTRRPVKLVWSRQSENRKTAMQEERKIKKLPKKKKISKINTE
jgi:putative endonuclease